jgi:AraC-like DNA-binding protein
MFANSCTVKFKDHTEFFEAFLETGKTTGTPDKNTFIHQTSFASVRSESYLLSGNMEVVIFKIHPTQNISIQYEFDSDYLEVGYLSAGSVFLSENGNEGGIYHANNLFITPPKDFRGNLVFYKDQPSESIAFHTSNKIISEFFGEIGDDLWAEMHKRRHYRKNFFMPQSNIASCFLQIVNCDYPSSIKCLFFESKFREILTRIMADKLPDGDTFFLGEFEMEQIKKIPEILTDRIDNPPSIHALALELSLNTTTMQRSFKKIFGVPIYEYHRNIRLRYAATMLLDTNKSIFEIAIDTGYSNSGNFCNAFKKRYGVSPGQYRKNG